MLKELWTKSSTMSPIRIYEMNFLKALQLNIIKPTVLDVGGGSCASYAMYLPYNYDSVNIESTDLKPTYIVKPKGLWNLPKKYHTVICLNVLEHVYNYSEMIENIYDSLHKNGRAYIAVPFIYRYHSSPNDYFRYSQDALKLMFQKFRRIEITPIGTGINLVNYSNWYGVYPQVIRPIIASYNYLLDIILCKLSRRFNNNCGKNSFPIGFWIEVTK